ncbi:ArsA-related P-loop ATPase, partial [Pyxidicoccus sp. 3LFB2]
MLEALWDKRALLVSGKGGVGKTTLSAALAVAAARTGRPVLLGGAGARRGPARPPVGLPAGGWRRDAGAPGGRR